jgi:hypothetical protein
LTLLLTVLLALLRFRWFYGVQERFDEWRAIDDSQFVAAEPRKLTCDLVVHEYDSGHVHQDDFFVGFSMAHAGRFQL